MKNKHRGFLDADGGFIIIISFMVVIIGGLIAFAVHSRTVEHRNIDATPITTINGQKVHIFNNKIYPVVIIENKEQTIYDPPEINK